MHGHSDLSLSLLSLPYTNVLFDYNYVKGHFNTRVIDPFHSDIAL